MKLRLSSSQAPGNDKPRLTRASKKIKTEIEERFVFFPPFFTPALETSEILEVLWRQSPSAYGNNGKVHYREEGKNGTVNYELAEDVPGE